MSVATVFLTSENVKNNLGCKLQYFGKPLNVCNVSHRDRKRVAIDLKEIYQAPTPEEAERQLTQFESKWAAHYPPIVKNLPVKGVRITPTFGYPAEVQRNLYTTNSIQSLNMTLRKIIKTRSLFPSDEAVFKMLYLALRHISNRWTMRDTRLGSSNESVCDHL